MLRLFLLVLIASSGTLTLANSLVARSETCDSTLLGHNGFEVCLFDTTGNLITDILAGVGNSFWAVQNILKLGHCFCNQACKPSQIVCKDPEALENLDLTSNSTDVLNAVSQLVYNIENYQAYCYCPELIKPGQKKCPTVAQPEKCPVPEDS